MPSQNALEQVPPIAQVPAHHCLVTLGNGVMREALENRYHMKYPRQKWLAPEDKHKTMLTGSWKSGNMEVKCHQAQVPEKRESLKVQELTKDGNIMTKNDLMR